MINENAKREIILTPGNLSNELNLKELHSFDNFAGFNTASANFLARIAARGLLNADRLQIRVKATTSFVVSMWNIVSELRTFSADIASFCHNN